MLFDQEQKARIHDTWRNLIASEDFNNLPGRTSTDRIARSYERLRLVNSVCGDAEELSRDPYRLASLHEWSGAVDGGLCTLASVHYNLFLGSLTDHDEAGRDLSEFRDFRRTGTFLCTELEHGNDASSLQTTAVFDRTSGGFVLHTPTPGAQKFMPNTSTLGGQKSAVVAARLLVDGEDQGVFLFLTPLSDEQGILPRVRVRPLPRRIGPTVDHCLTSFDHLWLPREAMLEAEHGRLSDDGTLVSTLGNRRKRFLQSIGRVTVGKLCMSASGLGMARAALTIAVRYAHHRYISGPKAGERIPLAAHRSHHGRLLYGLANAYAMTLLHRTVVSRWSRHTEDDRAEIERLAAMAKSWITWQARDIAIECRERCGAQGLSPVNGLVDLQLNIEGAITAEGDNLVIYLKAASEMLFNHRTSGLTNDIPCAEQSLADVHYLRSLLADIEAMWQSKARAALRQGPAGNPVGRWNTASSAAVKMVDAHVRLQAADALLAAAAEAVGPMPRFLLHKLAQLFLLKELGEHTGDLLAEGRLHIDHVRQLSDTIEEAVADLAPHMMALVDAFDLPEEVLSAIPIANSGYSLRFNDLVGSVADDAVGA
ncbi:acyl-CoA dehydrogenase [Streptomyces monticola]|uniref:Acyl-CoA dehydrogenase n=1 Tax=Streptomyces monticola TaxID=2666263 RepID=A0ABW2JVL9_9ACTN